MKKKSMDAEKRKQKIMETALRLFVQKGYEQTSTNDIIDVLNISRGGLYHHFKSKEEILDTAIYEVLMSEVTKMTLYIKDDSIMAMDKLKTLIEFNSPSQPMGQDVMTMIHMRENPTLLSHLLRIKLELVTPLYEEIIYQAIKEGIIVCKYPQEISKISVILSTILFSNSFMTMSQTETTKMIDAFRIGMEAMLGAKPGVLDFMNHSIEIGK